MINTAIYLCLFVGLVKADGLGHYGGSSGGFSGSSNFASGSVGFGGSRRGSGSFGGAASFGGSSSFGGFSGDLTESIPGTPGSDYPIYDEVPSSNFQCNGRVEGGYYADPQAECQAFHVCVIDAYGQLTPTSFLCPNGTLFNQQYFICDWWFNVDCSQAEGFYSLNEQIAAERQRFSNAGSSSGGSRRFSSGSSNSGFSSGAGSVGGARRFSSGSSNSGFSSGASSVGGGRRFS